MTQDSPGLRIFSENNEPVALEIHAGADFARIRLEAGGQDSRYWDIASNNDGLNFYTSDNNNNILVLWPTRAIVNGDLEVHGNYPKSFVEDHPVDPTKEIVYTCLEGDMPNIFTRGTGELVDGEALIELPEHFGFVTSPDGLTMHLTPRGEWLQLYIGELSTSKCVIREAGGKSGQFDYLLYGVRRGFENHETIRSKNGRVADYGTHGKSAK